MKRKHMVRAAAAVLACAALTGAALALSTGDSLISLSYLNDTYIPTVVAQGTKAADEKLIQAYQAASQKLDEVNQGYGVQQGSGGSYSADLRSRDMVRGDQLKLPTGRWYSWRRAPAPLSHRGGDRRDCGPDGGIRSRPGERTPLSGGGGHLRRLHRGLRPGQGGGAGEL